MATTIDPKSLRVVDLKEELGKRNLSKAGKKDELVARLTEALSAETTAAPSSTPEETESEAPPTTEATTTEDVSIPTPIQETKPLTEQPIMAPPTIDDTQQNDLPTMIEQQAQMNDIVESQSFDTSAPVETTSTTMEEKTATAPAAPAKTSEDSAKISSSTATTTSSPPKTDQAPPPSTSETAPLPATDAKTEDQQVSPKRKRVESVEDQQDKRTKMETSQPTAETKESSSSAPVEETGEKNAVCIKGFVRPLITKHLQEFIKQYGQVGRFWIDPIKTHCYIIFETVDQATNAFQSINGMVYPPTNTGKEVTTIQLTSTQASKLMDREQQVADNHGRVNWEKLLEKVLNNEAIDSPAPADQSPTNAKRRLGGLEQITRQLQQRGTVSTIMEQEQQPLPSASILDRLSTPVDIPVPATEGPLTIAGVSRRTDGKSLDDHFLKTKANPPLYYLPVDKDTAASRLEAMQKK